MAETCPMTVMSMAALLAAVPIALLLWAALALRRERQRRGLPKTHMYSGRISAARRHSDRRKRWITSCQIPQPIRTGALSYIAQSIDNSKYLVEY